MGDFLRNVDQSLVGVTLIRDLSSAAFHFGLGRTAGETYSQPS